MVVALKMRRRSTLKVLRYVATGVLVVAALIAARHGWLVYVTSPWTRDGMVRVQVANVAPQISGQIVEVRTFDNQHVHKGDILYVIEKFDFEVALDNAKANILNREADLAVKKAQNARRAILTTLSRRYCLDMKLLSGAGSRASQAASVPRTPQAARRACRTSIRYSPGFVSRSAFRCGSGSTGERKMCRSLRE